MTPSESSPDRTARPCRAKSTRSRAAAEQLAAPRRDLVPDLRQHDLARTPLDELRRQLLL